MCYICRSSEAGDVDKAIYGSTVPVLKGETLTVRILVSKITFSFHLIGYICVVGGRFFQIYSDY